MQLGTRRSSVFASILAAASLATICSAADAAPPAAVPAQLCLRFVDLCDTVPELRHETLREIQALLEPTGIRVAGREVFPGQTEASGGVYVILMPFDPSRPRSQPVGGAARRESGRQLTVWAFPPWVAGGLGLDLSKTPRWTDRQRREFARALAAVVVHELAHALAGAGHRPNGLMSARLGREQLLDPSLVVGMELHRAFVAGVAALCTDGESPPAGPRAAASTR